MEKIKDKLKKFLKDNRVFIWLIIGVMFFIIALCVVHFLDSSQQGSTKEFLLYNVFISLLINIAVSLSIMLFFNARDRKNSEKRRELLFGSLVYSIKNFNQVVGQMYKATSKIITEDDPILKSIYSDKEKLLEQINKLDFKQKAPIEFVDGSTICWYEYLISISLEFVEEISNIKRIYLVDMDETLLELIKKISPNESSRGRYPLKIMKDIYNSPNFKNSTNKEPLLIPLKLLIDDVSILMEYIDKQLKKKNFILDKNHICGTNSAPQAESGLKK